MQEQQQNQQSTVDPKNTLYPITVLIDELKSDDKKQR